MHAFYAQAAVGFTACTELPLGGVQTAAQSTSRAERCEGRVAGMTGLARRTGQANLIRSRCARRYRGEHPLGQSATPPELRCDGLQCRCRVFASGDSSHQPSPVHVGP